MIFHIIISDAKGSKLSIDRSKWESTPAIHFSDYSIQVHRAYFKIRSICFQAERIHHITRERTILVGRPDYSKLVVIQGK
jgi:hypothetical protein